MNNAPPIIDTVPVWVNGSIVYVSPNDPLPDFITSQIHMRSEVMKVWRDVLERCAEFIVTYPQEALLAGEFTLRVAGLAGVVGAILYLASEPQKKSRQNAPGAFSKGQAIPRHPPPRHKIALMAFSPPTVPAAQVERQRRRPTISIHPEIQAKVRHFAQELIEQYGDAFQDPKLKTLRRCLPPRPRARGYPEVTRAIRMLDELHGLYPDEPPRALWRRIYPAVIAGYDSLGKLERPAARQELRERVRWRRRQVRYRARKRKTT